MNLKQLLEDWIGEDIDPRTWRQQPAWDARAELRAELKKHLPSLLAKIEQLLPPEKELVVKDKIREYLGNHQYGDMVEINILNPKMTKEEQEQARGYNQALKDVRDALLNTKEPKG